MIGLAGATGNVPAVKAQEGKARGSSYCGDRVPPSLSMSEESLGWHRFQTAGIDVGASSYAELPLSTAPPAASSPITAYTVCVKFISH